MKKILLCIMLFALVGCTSENPNNGSTNPEVTNHKQLLENYVENELYQYTFTNYWNENEVSNEIATAILMLEGYVDIDFEELCNKNNKTLQEIKSYYENRDIYSIYDVYNMILVYKVLDLGLEKLETYCTDLTNDDLFNSNDVSLQYNQITALKCLNLLNVNSNLQYILKMEFYDINSLHYKDADFISMITIALNGSNSDDYTDYLLDCLEDGGVYDLDWETGQQNKLNCATTSITSIALIINGIEEGDMTQELLNFKTNNGFKLYLDDNDADLSYSSPQVFLALTTIYLYNENGSVSLY